jgi:hypothetical protein
MNTKFTRLALVVLGITSGTYAKVFTINNNSNENIHLKAFKPNGFLAFAFDLTPHAHVTTKDVSMPTSLIVEALKSDNLAYINMTIKKYRAEISKDSSQSTYNISIVDNRIVVS